MSVETKTMKPLGHKSYGSIAHLPGSKNGPGDYTVHEGQARIATEHVPGRNDRVIITEKLDGSNVSVAKVDGQILALGRAGYLATTSKFEQHHLFAHWVRDRWTLFDEILEEGERICGEWLALAHGTRYEVDDDSVFVAFDIMRGHDRIPYSEVMKRAWNQLYVASIIEMAPHSPESLLSSMPENGYHGAKEPIEGIVYRVETDGKFNFMAKYVKPEFETGKYLFSEQREIWNWRP